MEEELIAAQFRGEAESVAQAKETAGTYQNCPYIHFMATKEKQVIALLFLPKKQVWWLESIRERPEETFGLKKADFVFMEAVQYPKPLKMRVPRELHKLSPCDSDCTACPAYEQCLGCPATIHYKGRRTPS